MEKTELVIITFDIDLLLLSMIDSTGRSGIQSEYTYASTNSRETLDRGLHGGRLQVAVPAQVDGKSYLGNGLDESHCLAGFLACQAYNGGHVFA